MNSRFEAIQIKGQWKTFCTQNIPESSCAMREIVEHPYNITGIVTEKLCNLLE